LLFGGAEGVVAQDPMTGVIGSLPAKALRRVCSGCNIGAAVARPV